MSIYEEDNSTDSGAGGETCTESETPSQTPSIMIDSTLNGDSAQPPQRERDTQEELQLSLLGTVS